MKYNLIIKQPKQLKKKEDDPTLTCEHDYREFKETIRADNEEFSGTSYFKVKGCLKCHKKIRIDYVVL